jgi:hypothetical protein
MTTRVLALLGLLVASARADVKPEDAARAAKLFEQGQAAVAANKIDAGCVMFETSLKLDPQVGTRLNLADCREKQARFVEAYTLFVQAGEQATRESKPGRATFAQNRAQALRSKLVQLTFRVDAPVPGESVKVAGRELPREDWAKPQIVMPGPVTVDASAPGHDPVHVETTATGGVGAAILGTSIGIGVHTKLRYDSAHDKGDSAGVDRALHEADLATEVGIAGGVVLAVGVVLYLRSDRHVAVTPGPGTVGLAIQLTTP